jgi:hypothetical protein
MHQGCEENWQRGSLVNGVPQAPEGYREHIAAEVLSLGWKVVHLSDWILKAASLVHCQSGYEVTEPVVVIAV